MAFSTLILLRLPQRKGSPRRSRQFTDQAPLPSIDVCLIYIEHLKFPPWRFVSGLCNPSQLAHTSQSRTRTPYGMKVCMCRMETFKFPLLQQLIFPPHQTFHITTPLEWDFGSVKGLVNWWNDSWCFRSCDIVIEKDKGISSAVVINKLQSQNPTPVRHPIAHKHNKFWNQIFP